MTSRLSSTGTAQSCPPTPRVRNRTCGKAAGSWMAHTEWIPISVILRCGFPRLQGVQMRQRTKRKKNERDADRKTDTYIMLKETAHGHTHAHIRCRILVREGLNFDVSAWCHRGCCFAQALPCSRKKNGRKRKQAVQLTLKQSQIACLQRRPSCTLHPR